MLELAKQLNVLSGMSKLIGPSVFDAELGVQKIDFEVECSKGTYVRTLAVDLGKKLGIPAVMSDLTRLESGGFKLDQAIKLSELQEMKNQGTLEQALFKVGYALRKLPQVELTNYQWKIVKNGGFLKAEYLKSNATEIVLNYQEKTRAVYKYNSQKDVYQPETMIDLT